MNANDRTTGRRALLAAGVSGLAVSVGGCLDGRSGPLETFDGEVSVDPSLAPADSSWSVADGDAANTRSVPADAVPDGAPSLEWADEFETHVGHVHPVVADGIAVASDWVDDLFALDVETGDRLWTATGGFEPRTVPVIAADAGAVLIGTRSSLRAVDRETGDSLWRTDASVDFGLLEPGPNAGADLALVTTPLGVAAHDLESGDRRWERRLGLKPTARSAIRDETVYVGGGDASLHALGHETGDLRWRVNADDVIRAGPAVTDDRVYVGTDAGTLIACDRRGDVRWRTDLGAAAVESLAVGNGIVCAATGDDAITVVDPDGGDRVWRSERYLSTYAGGPVVGGGLVFGIVREADDYGTRRPTGGVIGAFDAETGTLEWESDAVIAENGVAVVDGAIYLTGREERNRGSLVAKLS